MKTIEIIGNKTLSGTVRISGAKNASVALIPAAILSDDIVTLCNLPEISDIDALTDILKALNVDVNRATETAVIDPKNMINVPIEKELSQKLRASYYFMGALLGKYKKVEMYFPGGCNIGKRPINLHLDAFKKLGATIVESDNNYIIEAQELKGTTISLDVASVGATINIMLAAVKAKGITIIENAAREPEIVNVATFLNNMGAKISGAGTSIIKIKGVNYLGKGFVEVIPDRIEAGTYAIIGALVGDNFKVDNIITSHLDAIVEKLKNIGCNITEGEDYLLFNKVENFKSTKIKTQVYPGFPTDLQQPFSVLLTQCNGNSKVEETIYENRFMHIPYLNKMGANITVSGDVAIIKGKTQLTGQEVVATDLRAGAALVVAGLLAEGKTTIAYAEHILRGYENIIEKLTELGAKIAIK
ncbi:MAG TPA: UDP-N-acetylglucosamine 1-carboxyvinyltransferase [Bacilli bacterium]|nr:UDP-N-acetylglucosamine 1-carboxyvinyltransferase [Bacilli bacterium]